MKGAFQIEGVDTEAGTVVLEVDRTILAPISKLLRRVPSYRHNRISVAVRTLGYRLRDVAEVLYGEADAEQFGFAILDPVEDEDEQEVCTGTGG